VDKFKISFLAIVLLVNTIGLSQEKETVVGKSWRFVSIPDFVNRDVPYPEPKLDGILDFVLDAVKAENPDFTLVLGDMVNGRWWMQKDITLTKDYVYEPIVTDESKLSYYRNHLKEMAKLYHGGWVSRMKAQQLKFYVGVGDHELGDGPWVGIKKQIFPDFEKAFRDYYKMPLNGPANKKGLSYYFIKNECLFIVIDPFEQQKDGEVMVEISKEQLNWMEEVFKKTQNTVRFRVVGSHVPVLTRNIKVNASSQISLKGEENAPVWQLMKKYDVDLFLCGEYHDMSCQESDGILQVVHGALMGFSEYMNYLIVTVEKDALHLELKAIKTVFEKPVGEPDRLSRIARISEDQLTKEPALIGEMRLVKIGKTKSFTGKTGIFAERYTQYGLGFR